MLRQSIFEWVLHLGDGGGGVGSGRGGGVPALSGRNRHMGELPSLMSVLSGPGMTDTDIARVICPPPAQRNRETEVSGADTKQPPLAEWRMTTPIGVNLSAAHVVRANHFRVNPTNIPGALYKYHVHIYSINIDGSDKEEVAATEDVRITIGLMTKLRTRHPEWETLTDRNLGYSYDGKTLLLTSADLQLPSRDASGQQFLSEVVGIPDRNGKFLE